MSDDIQDAEETDSAVVYSQNCDYEKKLEEQTLLKNAVTHWQSIYVSGFFAILNGVQLNIFVSSQWPFLRSLDSRFPESSLGYIVSMFSIAQFITSPLFGYWSDQTNAIRWPLHTSFLLMALGNCFYFCAQFFSIHYLLPIMMTARFLVGAGGGNHSLLRTHVAAASTVSDRTRAMAVVSGGVAFGTIIGPGFQLLFTPLKEEGVWFGPFHLNIFTAPAVFSCALSLASSVIMELFFEDIDYSEETGKNIEEGKNAPDLSFPLIGISLVVATKFFTILTYQTMDTIGSPYSMMMFSFNSEEAVKYNAGSHAITGAIGASVFVYFIFFKSSKKVSEVFSCILTLFILLAMYLATFSYPGVGQPVEVMGNGTESNCDYSRFSWCSSLTKTPAWLYYFFYVITFGWGFSLISVVMPTLYSKIIGNRKQGALQGIFQMASSAGRLLGSLASFLYTWGGPRLVWGSQIVEYTILIILWIVCIKKLTPRVVPT